MRVAVQAEPRLLSGIDPRERRVGAIEAEGPHAEPLRAEILLNRALGKSILIHGIGDGQRLPPVHIIDKGAGKARGHWIIIGNVAALIDGIVRVRSRLCPVGLPRAVVDEPRRDCGIDRVAHARRRGGVQGEVISGVT